MLASVRQITCLANSLLKLLACRFARKLKWANIPVNEQNYVLLPTAEGTDQMKASAPASE